MKDIEIVVFNDKSWVRFTEYQKLDEELKQEKQSLAKRIYELQSDLSKEKSKNEKLIEDLKNEKQLNAEIKKRLVEVEHDCEEFNHEYCDINCKGKRKELVDIMSSESPTSLVWDYKSSSSIDYTS
jgi:septal ring factor EnvC (AmiA/AmiB activator)